MMWEITLIIYFIIILLSLLFGTPKCEGQVNIQALSIAGVSVVMSGTAVVNLGVAFDS